MPDSDQPDSDRPAPNPFQPPGTRIVHRRTIDTGSLLLILVAVVTGAYYVAYSQPSTWTEFAFLAPAAVAALVGATNLVRTRADEVSD